MTVLTGSNSFARITLDTDRPPVLVYVEKIGPAFITGQTAGRIFVRAPRPAVEFVDLRDLTDEERERFRIPKARAAVVA